MNSALGRGITAKDALIKIDSESWQVRAMRWSRPNPCEYRGKRARLANQTPIEPKQVVMDGAGNITDMPLLVGKPCFGVPTAFLRNGGKQPVYVYGRKPQPSRCMKCKARIACEEVSRARIKLITELPDAIVDWQNKGGRKALKQPTKNIKCTVAFEKIARLTRDHPFTSSNDAALQLHYERERAAYLEKDRNRKRRERARKIRNGQIDEQAKGWLRRERFFRLQLLRDACKAKPLPPKLRHLNEEGIMNTADVWYEKAIMEVEGKSPNASAIAKTLIESGQARTDNHNSLRARVASDLKRIAFLEQGRAGAIWPSFNAKRELEDFTRRELR